ncbi:uncharacterized protein LOC119326810 isoform X1 [Triticum dicoccoides]|uniref:uncharacterized protein LOC119326810 isoform X1 n=2 Tax=Triticum dicoccoides TaxID=85692 RepID=UPI00188EB6E0|nr:uncharacterized protein LOC119326810 isoform X1 [Triticum dicoccoides]XP_037456318.1 uncharacterized protein LOC119326810 isoform X1 [Triticum dicoccoides]
MSLHIRTHLAAADQRVTPIKIPPHEIRTKIFFMIYNMSTDNIEANGFEFNEVLMEQYYPWFAQYMVMQRVCIDPNFHDICLMFLHKVNSTVLYMEILKATYANCKMLLRSAVIKSCSGERTLLKNIGIWFGKSAIQWNQDPSTYVDGLIPLIVKAYQKGLMLAVVQFISKILEPCQPIISVGTMEILSLLAEIYTKPDLQLSLEYNIKVLFRNFDVDAEHTKTNYLLKDVKREVAGNQDFVVKDVVHVPTWLCPAFLDQEGEASMPLTQYITSLKPIMRTVKLVGEMRNHWFYWVVAEKAKSLMASIIRALHDLHEVNICPVQFCASNIVVTYYGRVKIRVACLKKTVSMVRKNYEDASNIIMDTLFADYKPTIIPKDVDHLFSLMKSPIATGTKYVIGTHASLIPLGNRFQFYLDMCDHITSVVDPELRSNIHGALDDPYGENWSVLLEYNILLKESFYRSGSSYNTKKGAIEFLRFYRNTLAHRMDKCKKLLKNVGDFRTLIYTKEDIEMILLVTYPMILPRMQEELQNHKRLKDLNLHNLNFK